MQGTQYGSPDISARRASKVTLRAVKGTLPVHADGETIATEGDVMEIELLPAQLDMFLPQERAK